MSKFPVTLLKTLYVGGWSLITVVACLSSGAHAANSYTGATGLFYVPSAEITPEGSVNLQQNNDQYLRPNNRYVQQFDLEWLYSGRSSSLNGTVNFSIGLFPNLEIGGRLSNFSLKTPSGPQAVITDLSGNVKWQFLNWRDKCFGAIGMLDFAGEAQQFGGKYLAATCSADIGGKWTSTAAYVDTKRSNARPSGLVGGLTYQPFKYLQFLTEYEGAGWNSGLRINSGSLFGKFKLSAVAKVHTTVAGTDNSVGIDLQFPLGYGNDPIDKNPPRSNTKPEANNPTYAVTHEEFQNTTLQPSIAPTTGDSATAKNEDVANTNNSSQHHWVENQSYQKPNYSKPANPASTKPRPHQRLSVNSQTAMATAQPLQNAVADEKFAAGKLVDLLSAVGFEQIRVEASSNEKHIVVGFADNIYRNSYIDGVAVASGITARYAERCNINTVQILVSRQDVKQLVMHFSPTAYTKFLNGETAKAPIKVRFANDDAIVGTHATPRKSRYQLLLTPEIANFVGTERGVHDYSIAAKANLSIPLHSALKLKAGYRLALDNTEDFEKNRAFRASRLETGVTNAYLEWAAKPLNYLTLKTNIGYASANSHLKPFGQIQLALTPFDGRHQLAVSASSRSTGSIREHSVLGSYSYFFVNANTRVVIEGGRFAEDQTGFGVSIDRYFDDTIIRLFSRGNSSENLVAGLAVNFPLGGRRRSSPNRLGVQLGLEDRFKYGLETTVNRADGTNQLAPKFLKLPNLPLNLQQDYLDYQKLTPAYLNSQSTRLREAYHRFAE